MPCSALPYLEAVSRTSSWGLLDGVSDTGYFIVFSYFFLLSVATVTLDDQPVRVMPRKSGREMLVHCDLRGHPRDPPLFCFECNAAQKFPGGNNLGRSNAQTGDKHDRLPGQARPGFPGVTLRASQCRADDQRIASSGLTLE